METASKGISAILDSLDLLLLMVILISVDN